MRKGLAIFCALLLTATLAAIPFLCAHCSLLPEKATAYYEQKARREAQAGDSPEAQLMQLLLGGAAQEEAEEEPSRPAFSAYGLHTAVAAAAGGAVAFGSLAFSRRKEKNWASLFAAVCLAVPLGLLGARLTYCAANAGFYLHTIEDPAAMLRIWEGGLSLSGALAGAALGGVIAAKGCKAGVKDTLDALSRGLLTFAGYARLNEALIGAGYGPEWGLAAPRLPTWQIMAFASLLILCLRADFPRYAFLYGGVMILLESLRRDGHMLWGFVHAEQVLALCMALPALLYWAAKIKKAPLALAATAALAGAVVALEFALDRSPVSDLLLYGVYALAAAAYIALGLRFAKRAGKLSAA